MTKGYLVCCQYRHRGWDPEEDTFHGSTVYTNMARAIEDIRRVYEEQLAIINEEATDGDELVENDFDEKTGTFSLQTDLSDEFAYGCIDEVTID